MSLRAMLVAQVAGYGLCLVFSLCVIVSMSMHVSEFGGRCALFSGGHWRQQPDNSFVLVALWALRGHCSFVIVVGVLTNIAASLQIYRLSLLIYKGMETSFLSAFFEAVCCISLCGLTLAAALMVSLGFMAWCQKLEERYPSCEDAVGQKIVISAIYTSGFYTQLNAAQLAVWTCFTTSVGLAVCSMLKLCHCHRRDNCAERRRLIRPAA